MSNRTKDDQPAEAATMSDTLPGTASVVIACKLPHGLVMELGKVGDSNYRRFELAGANGAPRAPRPAIVAGGYGLTTVPEDFWKAWYLKHKDRDYVKNGAIFAQDSLENARAQGDEQAGVKTGFERLDPEKPIKGVTIDRAHMEQGRRDISQLRGI